MLALVAAAVAALDGDVVLQEGGAEDHELGPPLVEGAHLDRALEGRVPLVDVLRVEDLQRGEKQMMPGVRNTYGAWEIELAARIQMCSLVRAIYSETVFPLEDFRLGRK